MLRPNLCCRHSRQAAPKPPDPISHPLSSSLFSHPGGSMSIPKSPRGTRTSWGAPTSAPTSRPSAQPPGVPLCPPRGTRGRAARGDSPPTPAAASSAGLAPGPLPNSSPAFLSNEALIGSRLRFPSPLLRALQSQRCRAIRLRFRFFCVCFFFFNMAELFWKGQDRYMTGFLKNPRLRLSDGAFSSGFAQYTSLGSDRLEQLLLIIDASFPLAHYSKDFCVF